MPRLSLWRENHGSDYKFIDRRISEMFTTGGTGILVHKYLGTASDSTETDATQPSYTNQSELNIQDLLFLENRDRKYEPDVYSMRGIYQVTDQDFDLKQFGIFLATGTTFMTFHLNDMVQLLGRKIMAGDVIELMHLRDYHSLDESVPFALKRFYVVAEATRAAEGFSATWYPHLWRAKLQPLVDSQEYKDILSKIGASSDPFAGNVGTDSNPSLSSLLSTYDKYLNLNESIVEQAEVEVPTSGYDTSRFYTVPAEGGVLGDPDGINVADPNLHVATDSITADSGPLSPTKKISGYLTGDGTAPNGLDVSMGVAFPALPNVGDYFLRLDFVPNRLFRYDGRRWIKVEDAVRTNLTPGATDNKTQRNLFVNNTGTYTDKQGNVHVQRQSLSKALTPRADN
jgi:hypothetical protein